MIWNRGLRFACLLAVSLVIMLGGVCPASAGDLARQRKNLKEIQGRIDNLSRQLKSSQQQEGSVEQELRKLENQLATLQGDSSRLQGRLSRLEKDIAAKEQHAGQLKTQITKQDQQVRRRLRVLYRRGEMRLFNLLFEQASPAKIAENFFYLAHLVRRDRQLLKQFRDDWRTLHATLGELEQLRKDQRQRLDVLAASRRTLDKGRQTRQAALGNLRDNRAALKDELSQLRQKAKRLQSLLKTLETEKPREYSGASGPFGRKKGSLPWPGPGSLAVRFGSNFNAELGTRYESQGIELAQAAGSPIYAVAEGKVAFAKVFHGFGNMIILDHGGGYFTLYAQASQLLRKAGDTVAPGDKIGMSGFGGGKTLYFEIRKRGTPLDPLQWLKPRR